MKNRKVKKLKWHESPFCNRANQRAALAINRVLHSGQITLKDFEAFTGAPNYSASAAAIIGSQFHSESMRSYFISAGAAFQRWADSIDDAGDKFKLAAIGFDDLDIGKPWDEQE